ncbi:MFS transporter [Limibacillus halophilus]|uniref:MFS family permease n=1 Tax=Limibacillus halophilus TaxID=1579333 RepID=A0A839SRE6_9PROT|nr:MFS transporter [Limibacillus halophilus]MBB3064539.1 MFS family permease [Limibacillus halophilus]
MNGPVPTTHRNVRIRLTLALIVIVTMTIGMFSTVTFRAFDQAVAPELEQRMQLLGMLLRADLQRPLELGIPLDAVAGFDERVADIVKKFPEVQSVQILTRDGTSALDISDAAASAAPSNRPGTDARTYRFAVLVGSVVAAEIVLTENPRLLETQLLHVLFDIAIVALAIVVIGVEVILLLAARSIWLPRDAVAALLEEQSQGRFDRIVSIPAGGPLSALAARLNDRARHLAGREVSPPHLAIPSPLMARMPLFLLALGTETTASFLPVMARDLHRWDWLSPAAAAAAPLVAYLLAAATVAPFAGPLVRHLGPRSAFLWSVIPIVTGLALMAESSGVLGAATGRMLVAVGYTIAATACSLHALWAGGRAEAARTQASINSALYGGVLAGSIIGGVAAFEVGYSAAILLGAVVVIIAGSTAHCALSGSGTTPSTPRKSSTPQVHEGRTFAAIAFGLAVPLSITTAMVIWYLVPLLLSSAGFDAAMTARVVMLYYLCAVFVAPLVGHFLGTTGSGMAASAGALISGLALLIAGALDGSTSLIVAVAVIGVGHAMLRAPIFALVNEVAESHPERIDHLRVIERGGAVVAFLVASVTASPDHPAVVFTTLGALTLSGLAVFAIISRAGVSKEAAGK